jgi:hypothetical protein
MINTPRFDATVISRRAAYAADHPGDVVFVASAERELSCMRRDMAYRRTFSGVSRKGTDLPD